MGLFGIGRIEKFEGDGTFDFDIVGESNYQAALERIAGAKTPDGHEHYCEATLRPEPSNPYDKNAVVVQIKGHTVGYLARADAEAYKSQSSKPMRADALIVGGWRYSNGNEGSFGVKLDIR